VLHAHRNDMKLMAPIRGAFSMAVGGRRLVINACLMTGDVYTAKLEPG